MAGRTRITRQDRDAVVRLLPKDLALVTTFLKHLDGKLVVSAFDLLHAQNIRLNGVEPTHHIRHASKD